MPLPQALFLYGLLLGAGLTTYVPATAAWALPALGLAVGDVAASLAIGLGFAVGRALPVLLLAVRGEETALAERPQGLRALRVLIAASLVLALAAGEARAAVTVATTGVDPSAADVELAWQHPGVGGFLLRNGVKTRLPGNDPAIGGALVAWHDGPNVTVASRDTLTPMLQEPLAGVQKLALTDRWLVWRSGLEIRVQPLSDPTRSALVVKAKRFAELGRPALDGDLVVYHYATPSGSWLTTVNVATGARDRCATQRTRSCSTPPCSAGASSTYAPHAARRSCASARCTAARSGATSSRRSPQYRGHEPGHTEQGERLPCPHPPKPTTRILWTTALSATTAYVTILRSRRGAGQHLP